MSSVNRREFLTAAGGAALLLPGVLKAQGAKRYPIAFSTLGCPKWPWSKIVSNAVKWEYTGIEMRVLEKSLNLPGRPEFSSGIAATMKSLKDNNLAITDLELRRNCTNRRVRSGGRNWRTGKSSSSWRTSWECRTCACSGTRL